MANRYFLVLGCNGKKIDNSFCCCDSFICCGGVENPILEIKQNLEGIQEIISYFKGVRLFELTLKDYNAIRRILFNIQDKYYQNFKPMWDKKYFELIEKFTIAHKECGLYLKIVVDANSL